MSNADLMGNLVSSPWISIRKANPRAKIRLFCFPYAGGGTLIYRDWHDYCPETLEVCAVQLPGRENRLNEQPFTKLEPIVTALAKELSPELSKPFVFFGHSMGARIAFELARKLRQNHQMEPLHLFVSGSPAPHVRTDDPPTYNLPDEEFVEELRSLNGTAQEVFANTELMRLMIPLLRADFEVVQTYRYFPGAPLHCPLTAYGGWQDREVPRDHVQAWREHTSSSFSLRMLPGDHFFLNSARPLLLQSILQELQRAGQGPVHKAIAA